MALGDINNNPGNIRPGTLKWIGQTGVHPSGYCIFDTMANGVRAMARTLRNYQRMHGIDTVRGVIERYAPASENQTDAYIADVAQRMGVHADDVIDLNWAQELRKLMEAMIHHELGHNIAQADLDEGIRLAFL